VEDEAMIAFAEKRALENYGYVVLHALSGESALEMIRSNSDIQLILMDIDLGKGIDGTVAAELILKEIVIPIVFLSSHTEPEVVEKTERITSYGYVVKNSSVTVLDASIKMAFKLFESQRTVEKTTQLLESTGKLAKVGGWQVDLSNMKLSWTPMTFEIAEVTPPNEPPLEDGIQLFAPEARPVITKALEEAMASGIPYDLELPIITAKGNSKWVQTQGFAEMKQGKAVRLFGTFQDITERKMIQLEMEKIRSNNETLINSSTDIMWSMNPDYTLIIGNHIFLDGFFKSTGVQLKAGDYLLIEDLFPAEYLAYWKSLYDRGLAGESFEIEIEIPTPEKNILHLYAMSFKPVVYENKTIGLCCYGRNITERRFSEEKINSLLKEKELILQEVHHRIKNNFATITALLKMQALNLKDKIAIQALEDASLRVHSMSVLYQKLYRSTEYGKLSLKDYLEHLVDEIISNFPQKRMVQIEYDLEDFLIDAVKIQSIGIIVNELIANIMKYAFVGRDNGRVFIKTSQKDTFVEVIVKDDGIGIPEETLIESKQTFGLLLVKELVSQLKGDLKISSEQGTKVFFSVKK